MGGEARCGQKEAVEILSGRVSDSMQGGRAGIWVRASIRWICRKPCNLAADMHSHSCCVTGESWGVRRERLTVSPLSPCHPAQKGELDYLSATEGCDLN